MKILIEIPDEILNLPNWEGEVKASVIGDETTKINAKLYPQTKTRLNAIKREIGIVKYTLSDEIKILIDYWNTHPFIKHANENRIVETRNYEITERDVKIDILTYNKAIKLYDIETLTNRLESYLQHCTQGKHIWDGDNHGYKNLTGLLRKIVDSKGQKLWFETNGGNIHIEPSKIFDTDEQTTQIVTKIFAKLVLHSNQYIIKNPSREYQCFMEAGNWLKNKFEKNSTFLPINFEQFIFYYVKCVTETIPSTIYPATLISENIKTIAFPQYLQQIFPGTKLEL